jgi:hypothetical protein
VRLLKRELKLRMMMGMVLLMRRIRGMKVGVMRMPFIVAMKMRMMGVLLGGIGIDGSIGDELDEKYDCYDDGVAGGAGL